MIAQREVCILTPNQSHPLPPTYRLESAVKRLVEAGQHRSLIELVEAWSQLDEPSASARIAQARALGALGLVDRAWARLQGLVEDTSPSAEVYGLTIELFVTRQWSRRARDLAIRALAEYPEDDHLRAQWESLDEQATQPDVGDLDRDGVPLETLLPLAHHLVSTGAHTRAGALLERLHREHPDDASVADLRWALAGDLLPEEDLHALVERYAPDLSALADLGEEPEHTESTTREDLLADERAETADFSSLFRGLPQSATESLDDLVTDDSEEVTKISAMADLSAMDTVIESTQGGEVTEIQRVIHHREGPELSEPTFDLNEPDSDYLGPEAEDEDVVVMVRKDEDLTEPTQGPTSDLALDPGLTQPDATGLSADEAETWIRPAPSLHEESEDEMGPAAGPPNRFTYWVAALLAVLGVTLVISVALVFMGLST